MRRLRRKSSWGDVWGFRRPAGEVRARGDGLGPGNGFLGPNDPGEVRGCGRPLTTFPTTPEMRASRKRPLSMEEIRTRQCFLGGFALACYGVANTYLRAAGPAGSKSGRSRGGRHLPS